MPIRSTEARRPRVQNGSVRLSTGGHLRPLQDRRNRLFSRKDVLARAHEWTRIAHLSFPRNEGVPGSSPGVGFRKSPGKRALLLVHRSRARRRGQRRGNCQPRHPALSGPGSRMAEDRAESWLEAGAVFGVRGALATLTYRSDGSVSLFGRRRSRGRSERSGGHSRKSRARSGRSRRLSDGTGRPLREKPSPCLCKASSRPLLRHPTQPRFSAGHSRGCMERAGQPAERERGEH
jgi:hypothetical protein